MRLSRFEEMDAVRASRGEGLHTFTPISGLDRAASLVEAIQRLALARTLPDVQRTVSTAARRLTGADGATLVLREGGECHYVDEDSVAPLWKGMRFPLGSCVSGWVMTNGEPAVIEDVDTDGRIPRDAYRPTFVRSMAMVPIRSLDPVGAIGNYWAERHRPTEQELELLQALAASTAVAMENVGMYAQLEDERRDTLKRLALVAEFRDDASFEHTQRVARTSYLVARQLGLPNWQVDLIRQAAPLHDIGKLAVSDTILLKPSRLDAEEFEKVKRHTEVGAEILAGSRSAVLELAGEIAVSHHEWWDGSGYPRGLRGEEIPLCGRIVAVADVFDALANERPYKSAWPVADAVSEVRRLAGVQFDPSVVAAFERLDPAALAGPFEAEAAALALR